MLGLKLNHVDKMGPKYNYLFRAFHTFVRNIWAIFVIFPVLEQDPLTG